MKLIKRIKDKVKRIKSRFDYRTKYHEALDDIEALLKKNSKLERRISELDFNLCKDNQAKKIENLESELQHRISVNQQYREETIKQNKKITKLTSELDRATKQLEYLRSGEYYKQLRFERDMLQSIVDNYKKEETNE